MTICRRSLPMALIAVVLVSLSLPFGAPRGVAAVARDCPIPLEKGTGGFSYINDWGFARSGGRTHQGNDLFAPEGTPIVAVEDGRAWKGYGSLGGNVVRVEGNSGWYYYNAHLSSYPSLTKNTSSANKVAVKRGDVIGYVGNTGNAITTPSHLHFQIHPGGQGTSATNPFPYLEDWCTSPPPIPDHYLGGVPSWATSAMTAAVDLGILSQTVRGDSIVKRYELAVTLERLALIPSVQPSTSGGWTTGVPDWADYSMGKAVAAGLLSSSVRGDATVNRAVIAVVLDRLGMFGSVAPAAPGTWSSGIPSWANTAMGKAVTAGVLSSSVRWSDTIQRYELAVVYDRLDLLDEWRVGTPAWAVPSMVAAVNAGLLSAAWPGNDVMQRYELAVVLQRSGFLDEDLTPAPAGTWSSGIPDWSLNAMGLAVEQGLFSASVKGTSNVNRAVFSVVLNRLGAFGNVAPAAAGAWSVGIPAWAHASMGKAVAAGALSTSVLWSDKVERYELAVVWDRLGYIG